MLNERSFTLQTDYVYECMNRIGCKSMIEKTEELCYDYDYERGFDYKLGLY